MDCIAADPPGIFRCQEGDGATDIVRLRQTLERLHAQRKVAAGVRLGEVRHIGLDHTGRHRIDADPAGAKQRGKMLHQRVNGALGCCIAGIVPTTPRAASDATRTILLPFERIGSSCWTRKKGARTLTANSLSKSSMVVSSMVADFETPALATRISRRSPTILRVSFASLCGPSAAARSAEIASPRPPSLRISATTLSASVAPRP